MHKGLYASGFLYNPASQQILLQQRSSSPTSSLWSLFENTYKKEGDAEKVFTKTIKQILHIQLDSIYPVYSYIDDALERSQFVFYAICDNPASLPLRKNHILQWFSFKEIAKLNIIEQIRHDIIVGQRVIEAAGRKARGEHTFQ